MNRAFMPLALILATAAACGEAPSDGETGAPNGIETISQAALPTSTVTYKINSSTGGIEGSVSNPVQNNGVSRQRHGGSTLQVTVRTYGDTGCTGYTARIAPYSGSTLTPTRIEIPARGSNWVERRFSFAGNQFNGGTFRVQATCSGGVTYQDGFVYVRPTRTCITTANESYCGMESPEGNCMCDAACVNFGDCCQDAVGLCF